MINRKFSLSFFSKFSSQIQLDKTRIRVVIHPVDKNHFFQICRTRTETLFTSNEPIWIGTDLCLPISSLSNIFY